MPGEKPQDLHHLSGIALTFKKSPATFRIKILLTEISTTEYEPATDKFSRYK